MANIIKLKRSTTTATPISLAEGEVAYSELSGDMFIGTAGANLEKIGGNTEVLKLAGIEAGATADQSNAEIKTAYEANANTNAFLDAEKSKLTGVEALADVTDTINVTAAGALMDSELAGLAAVKATTGTFLVADQSKLDGIATSANNYSLPTASSTVIGGVKTGAGVTNTTGTISVSTAYLADSHAASAVTSTKVTNWDAAHSWYTTMTTADGDSVINTVTEIVAAFENHAEGLNLITELDSKLTASSNIDGGTF